jgi:hypothetical protein
MIGEGIGLEAAERVEAMDLAANLLGLPASLPVALLNGLVLLPEAPSTALAGEALLGEMIALAITREAQVIASLIRWRSCSTIGRLSASECARVRLIVDDCVPHQVAIVQYDWPSHLREQTEKQRLIWGYKILFLDVLFPQVKGDDCDGVRRISDESPMDLRWISDESPWAVSSSPCLHRSRSARSSSSRS